MCLLGLRPEIVMGFHVGLLEKSSQGFLERLNHKLRVRVSFQRPVAGKSH